MENRTSGSVLGINYLWIGSVLGIFIGIEVITLCVTQFEFFVCTNTIHLERTDYWTFVCFFSGFTTSPGWCNTYHLGSCLVSAYNITYPTCAFWFYLFIIVVTVVNLVMFGIVAKWYKKRERNELLHEQRFVEDYIMINTGTFTESFSCCC